MGKLTKLKKKSLSDGDIMFLLNEKANIMTYPELTKYHDLDEALGPHSALVLLYETKRKFGHWTLVFKLDNDTVEFFDSYSLMPDDELSFIPEHYRIENNELLPHLTYLLYNSGYNVEFNDYKLQAHVKDTNTCGRHVVARLLFRNMDIDNYVDMISETGMDPDTFVTVLTNNISNHII